MARYSSQYQYARSIGKEAELQAFEQYAAASAACKAMPRWELERLISADSATAATYYQQISGRSRMPDDDKWNRLRRVADAAFFQGVAEDIHFAALSTEERWLSNYGDGAVFFKEEMISHRASLFEMNTTVWVEKNCSSGFQIPAGYRSTWERRGALAVAKLGREACEAGADFGSLILSAGVTSDEDSFIEVHIFGGFTVRSISKVIIRRSAFSDLSRENIIDRANSLGFTFKEVP